MNITKDMLDKLEFSKKRKELLDNPIITLKAQSTIKYTFIKDESKGLYFIRRNRDKKTILIGDKEASEDFILFGLQENIKDVLTLFKKADEKNELR